jgi:hypothetical protein
MLTLSAAITGNTAGSTPVEWLKSRGGHDYAVVSAYGSTWGGASIAVQYLVDDADTTNSWITIATLTSAAPFAMRQCPNGSYRIVVTGSTTPSLKCVIKPF